jgi:hypothetical protein
MLFECDGERIEKGLAWFVGPGAVGPLKNLIAIDWADPPISVLDWADRLVVQRR